ncbi:MAG: glutamate 5-kinase [Treponema sp.]|nr:glutamate 5-kinase [Treponema sp.]
MTIQEHLGAARKVVFKFGSNTLAGDDGRVNPSFMAEFAEQAACLMGKGKQIAIVSSGAQVAGLSTLDKWVRKRDLHYRQALCAVGQVQLMEAWRMAFEPHNRHIAQILLTREDFGDSIRTLNMRNTLFTLVDEGIIPIINENDTVSVEEIKIGDNDTLAARSAILWNADLLVLFSDIDGLHDKNPKEFPDAKLVQEVRDIDAVRGDVSIGAVSSFGTGGIATKLEAAKMAHSYGIPTILANGGRPRCLEALANGEQQGTIFAV